MPRDYYVNANKPCAPANITREFKKQRALELRTTPTEDGGVRTYEMIAEEMGVSMSTVWKWIVSSLAEIRYDTRQRARELRSVNTQRLELAIEKVLAKIASDEADHRDYNTLIRLIQTENKMWGVNEPDAVELTVKIDAMSTEEKIKRISDLMEQAYHQRERDKPLWKPLDEGETVTDTNVVDGEIVSDNGKSST